MVSHFFSAQFPRTCCDCISFRISNNNFYRFARCCCIFAGPRHFKRHFILPVSIGCISLRQVTTGIGHVHRQAGTHERNAITFIYSAAYNKLLGFIHTLGVYVYLRSRVFDICIGELIRLALVLNAIARDNSDYFIACCGLDFGKINETYNIHSIVMSTCLAGRVACEVPSRIRNCDWQAIRSQRCSIFHVYCPINGHDICLRTHSKGTCQQHEYYT